MRVARIDGEVRILPYPDDAKPLSLTEAFRAKILAGWEVPVYSGFQPGVGAGMVGEPVCRNERGTR